MLMKTLKELLNKWRITELRMNINFLEARFELKPDDKDAAWELHVELVTRLITYDLSENPKELEAALTSIDSIFSCYSRNH